MEEIIIPRHIVEEMVEYSREGSPVEVCGILSGTGSRLCKLYRMANEDNSAVSYFMSPQEQFEVAKKIRSDGHEMLAIFHSHPSSPAVPSQKDIDMAFYPECVYIIVSLLKGGPHMKGYSIKDRNVQETRITVINDNEKSH